MKLKKSAFFICLLMNTILYGQNKGDLGVLISSDHLVKLAVEFRYPSSPSYQLKIGYLQGRFDSYRPDPTIVSLTDSTIIQNRKFTSIQQWGLRLGFDRRLKESVFSLGMDINLNYRNRLRTANNFAKVRDENGEWVDGIIFNENQIPVNSQQLFAVGEKDFATINQHFFTPSLRINFNMDVPLGEALLIHFSLSTSYSLPVYMGATKIVDPNQVYGGEPPTTFEFQTNANLGLRYRFGQLKKSKV